jgi:16S rRNA processing protein RimM
LSEHGAPDSPQRIAIGRVARAHGLRGELRVELFNVESRALEAAKSLWLSTPPERAGAEYTIEWARPVPRAFLVKLESVSDRDAAEALKGATVWLSRAELPPPSEGQYYLVDLVGASVVGPDGEVGIVTAIAMHPSVDALVITTPDGRSLEQPLLDAFIARVSVEEKRVELATLDGLIG